MAASLPVQGFSRLSRDAPIDEDGATEPDFAIDREEDVTEMPGV